MPVNVIYLLGSILVALTVVQEIPCVYAGNNSSQPCFSGTCSYEIPDAASGPSGTVKLFGAQHAIGDITPAGGWEVVSCDSESMAQDITIVCQNSDDTGACAHLFSGPSGASPAAVRRAVSSLTASATQVSGTALPSDGTEQAAIGKIIRLPDSCGKPAFARISRAWIPTNQTIPNSVSRRLVRRAGGVPVVMAFSVDVDFHKADARHGNVGFALVGANVPGAAAIGKNYTSGFIGRDLGNNVNLMEERRQFGVPDFINGALGSINALDTFNVGQSITLPPFILNQSFTLINQGIQCSVQFPIKNLDPTIGVLGSLKVSVDANVEAVITLGVAASGFIIPPIVTGFALTSGLNIDINNSTINVNAGVGGSIGTGKIPLVSAGLQGIEFAGIMSVGPTFELLAQVTGTLDLDFGLKIGVDYHLQNANFVFPTGPVGGTFLGGDTPLSISLQPSGAANPKVVGSLAPTVVYMINAFGVGASVMANVVASATASLTIGATLPQQNITVTPPVARSESTAIAVRESSLEIAVTAGDTNGPSITNPLNGVTFDGCAEVDVGLSVNVAAGASFFGLFNPGVALPLFSAMVPLFKQCFGDPPATTRRRSESEDFVGMLEGRQDSTTPKFSCNDPDILGMPIIMANGQAISLIF